MWLSLRNRAAHNRGERGMLHEDQYKYMGTFGEHEKSEANASLFSCSRTLVLMYSLFMCQ